MKGPPPATCASPKWKGLSEPRGLEAVIHIVGYSASFTGDHRLRDTAALARQHRADARADRFAHVLEAGPQSQEPGGISSCRRHIAIEPSRRADSLEPQAAAIVIAAGHHGCRKREKLPLGRDHLPGP